MRNTKNAQADEALLLEGCLAGKREAQRDLFLHFSPRLMSICLRYCSSKEEARDILQDAFVKVFSSLDKYNGQSRLATWITRILINTAIDHFRSKIRHKGLSLEEMEMDPVDNGPETDPFETYSDLSADEIIRLIQQLPDGYRVVFNMYELEGYSHREIAVELGISENTSKSQLSRAKKLLQKIVIQEVQSKSQS